MLRIFGNLDICCNIVTSLVPSVGKNRELGFYLAPQLPHGFGHFCGAGNHPSPQYGAERGTTLPERRGDHPLKASKQAIKTFENKKHQKHELMHCALLTRAILTKYHFCREVFPKIFWSSEDNKKEKNIQKRKFFGGEGEEKKERKNIFFRRRIKRRRKGGIHLEKEKEEDI